jgi:hypothetical protein
MVSKIEHPDSQFAGYADLPGVRLWYTDSGGTGVPLVLHDEIFGRLYVRSSWEDDATWAGFFDGQLQLFREGQVTMLNPEKTQMPAAEELPAEIRDLAYRNGFELSHNRWESDVREMIRRMRLDVPGPGGQVETDRRPIAPGEAGGGSVPAGANPRVDREGPRQAAETGQAAVDDRHRRDAGDQGRPEGLGAWPVL